MRILKQPKPKTEMKARCDCGTVVMLNSTDLQYQVDPRDRDYVFWTCPTCRNHCTLDLSLIPQEILSSLLKVSS